MNIESFENLPTNPSLEAQAELEQRLMEHELEFDVIRGEDDSFSIVVKNDERNQVKKIIEELTAERDYSTGMLYGWLDEILTSGDTDTTVIYYNTQMWS